MPTMDNDTLALKKWPEVKPPDDKLHIRWHWLRLTTAKYPVPFQWTQLTGTWSVNGKPTSPDNVYSAGFRWVAECPMPEDLDKAPS